MALSGSFYNYPVQGSSVFGLYCEWTGSQNVGGNYTDVTLNVYLKYWSLSVGARADSTVSINGETETYTVPAINHYPNTQYTRLIKTKTTRVYHNGDGTKSCSLSASWRFSGTYSGHSIGTITASTTVTLDTIPRSSTISSASNVTLGNACSVTWTPASSSFRYKLKFSLGGFSYTTDYISPNRASSYTYTGYTVPISVSNQLTSATSGTMTVYLYSYSGSTQIGSTSSKTFTVYVPASVVPTLGSVTAAIVNSNSVINGWNIAVAGYTKVKLTATASGSYGSTIKSFKITGSYSANPSGSSLSYTGGTISSSGSKTFTIVAVDSRGRTSTSKTTSAITFYAYSPPSMRTAFYAQRLETNARKIQVYGSWGYSTVNNKNSATCTLYYKRSNQSNWMTYSGTISNGSWVTLTNEFEETYSYNFRIVVKDTIGSTVQEEAFVSTIEVLLDFKEGGKGLGIGKIAETDRMEVALDSVFIGKMSIRVGNEDVSLDQYIKNVINGT